MVLPWSAGRLWSGNRCSLLGCCLWKRRLLGAVWKQLSRQLLHVILHMWMSSQSHINSSGCTVRTCFAQ